jgi:hypothetical protein
MMLRPTILTGRGHPIPAYDDAALGADGAECEGLKILRIAPTTITARLKTTSAAIRSMIAATNPTIASTMDLIISPIGVATVVARYPILRKYSHPIAQIATGVRYATPNGTSMARS